MIRLETEIEEAKEAVREILRIGDYGLGLTVIEAALVEVAVREGLKEALIELLKKANVAGSANTLRR